MSATAEGVVGDGPVIVSPKKEPVQVKFRWDPSLLAELKELAERTDRSMNECGEMLIRWALERAKQELDEAGEVTRDTKGKK